MIVKKKHDICSRHFLIISKFPPNFSNVSQLVIIHFSLTHLPHRLLLMSTVRTYLTTSERQWVLQQYPDVKASYGGMVWIRLSEIVEEKFGKRIGHYQMKNQINSFLVRSLYHIICSSSLMQFHLFVIHNDCF